MLRRRPVLPLPAVDRERDHSVRRLVVLNRSEQPGLRQPRREVGVLGTVVVLLEGVQRAAVVVEEVQLPLLVLAEGDETHRRPRDLRHLLGAVALEAGGPQTARFPVAEDVSSAQLRELLAAIDQPAGDAAGDRVRQLDQRRLDRRRPDLLRLDAAAAPPSRTSRSCHLSRRDGPTPTTPSRRRRRTARRSGDQSSFARDCGSRTPRLPAGLPSSRRRGCPWGWRSSFPRPSGPRRSAGWTRAGRRCPAPY